MLGSEVIGLSRLPFRNGYVRAAFDLIITAASSLQPRIIVTPEMYENNITYHLEEEMRKAQSNGHPAKALNFAVRATIQADPDNPVIRGEIDIIVFGDAYGAEQDPYLAIEAKRLRGKGDSLADKYVTGGVADFVSAKYSRGHEIGAMLGYIVVPPIATAIEKVAAALANRREATRAISDFSPDLSWCSHPNTHQSMHLQSGSDSQIRIIHMFLDFCT